MSHRIETRHVVGRISLNTDDENDDLAYQSLIVELWSKPPQCLVQRCSIHDGCEAKLSFDWQLVGQALEEQLNISKLFRTKPDELPHEWWEVGSKEVRSPVQVDIAGANELCRYDWYPDFFLENSLYDIFIVANLALPGAADLSNVRVEQVGPHPRERLGLSAYYLDPYFKNQVVWPELKTLDIEVVDRWYGKVRPSVGQVPESPVEQALFALLHVCRSTGRPEDIVWLFYGFESLFQTRVGENFTALLDRIALVLDAGLDERKVLKTKLRALYDYRSSFVHGGLQVIHPAQYDAVDPRIQETYGRTVDLSVFGTRLLLACLQRYVAAGWSAVQFETSMRPIHVDAS